MKIYVIVDIEGASGYTWSESTPWLEEKGREYLTSDVNAAVSGAVDAGASEVIVADVHARSNNLIYDRMHPKASIVYGVPHYAPRFPGLDASVAGVFLIGYHAMAGTSAATLDHTFSNNDWHSVEVNGVAVGEAAIDAAIAGEYQVPVILVTGDDKVAAEARHFLGEIETAIVKIGYGRSRALCFSQTVALERIYAAARRAVENIGEARPFTFSTPVEVKITHKTTRSADEYPRAGLGSSCTGLKTRSGGYTTLERVERISDWFGGSGA